MADFKQAYAKTAQWEGGYANVTGDLGQETANGISRKFWPKWNGWKIVDANKPLRNGQMIKDPAFLHEVELFYLNEFWYRMKGDKITSQRVAGFIYDWYVNSGNSALKAIQGLVNVTKDGIMGNKSISEINAQNEFVFMSRLISARTAFVEDIVKRNPSQRKFLVGWLNRINSFK